MKALLARAFFLGAPFRDAGRQYYIRTTEMD